MAENRKLLLIVEDHEPSKRTFERILLGNGWSVQTATTLRGGLAALDADAHCVVIDLALIDDGSGDALARLRESHPALRVVAVSDSADGSQLDKIRDLRPEAVIC